jgi:hypothetical protein
MKITSTILLGALFVLAAGVSLQAHHSFAAQFDRSKPVTLTGPVTKLDWINPHARIFMDAKDAAGKVVNWEIELGGTAILMRNGWKRTDVKIGETVTITGSLAKDGSHVANATTVTLANGKRVFAGSSGGDGPPPK